MKPASVLLAVALVSGATASLQSQPRLINGFAAIVNDKVITYEDVESAVNPNELQLAQLQYGRQPELFAQQIDRLRNEALNNLIERELILYEFQTAGYNLPESLIDEQIRSRIREDFGDRARLIRTLQAQNSSLETFRRQVRERFILDAMTAKNIQSAIIISPYKIETYYAENRDKFRFKDRVRLRTISVWNAANRGPEATRKVATEALEKIRGGTAFAEVAQEVSEDPARRQGGDRGWIERGSEELRLDLQEVAFGLKPGTVSDLVEKEEGCYLMLVEEYEPEHVRPLPEVRDVIEEELRRRERARLREDWIRRLRSKSFVRLFPLK